MFPDHRRRRIRLRRRAGGELDRGVVARSLDLFLSTPLSIVGETSLFVRHNLLRRSASLDGVAAVCAHPQALAQCHGWLAHHLPLAERRPVASNAEGARLASLDETLAAVASERAASEYRLHVVAPAIQDDPHNRTRFAIVTDPARQPQPPSGHDCTSLVVSVINRPGAVHDMLVPLKAHGVSMSRFESRLARSGQWEYYFTTSTCGATRRAASPPRCASCAPPARSSSCSAAIPIKPH